MLSINWNKSQREEIYKSCLTYLDEIIPVNVLGTQSIRVLADMKLILYGRNIPWTAKIGFDNCLFKCKKLLNR